MYWNHLDIILSAQKTALTLLPDKDDQEEELDEREINNHLQPRVVGIPFYSRGEKHYGKEGYTIRLVMIVIDPAVLQYSIFEKRCIDRYKITHDELPV
jgi:hypothetical protein